MPEAINVWLVDDAELIRLTLPNLLNSSTIITCTECFEDAESLLRALESAEDPPDVVLLDIRLPKMNGLDAIPEIKELAPDCNVVIFTAYDEDENFLKAVSLGAVGYLLKHSKIAEIIKGIEVIQNGGSSMNRLVLGRLLHMLSKKHDTSQDYGLTSKEKEILRWADKGFTTKEIAEKLYVSTETIPVHFRSIHKKLDVHTRAGLLAKVKKMAFEAIIRLPLFILSPIIMPVLILAQSNDTKDNSKMDIKKEWYGTTPSGQEVLLYTLTNGTVTAKVINYGGIITELWIPDRKGNTRDVVLGFDNLQGYLTRHPYFGCIVGRYANRIANGVFNLDGKEYKLAQNNNGNHLHGGIQGFDRAVWDAEALKDSQAASLRLKYLSKDGEEGYPGNLSVTVIYSLSKDNELSVSYEATTDKVTVVNLTQHSYFNLGETGNALGHLVTINADQFTVADKTLIPTGELSRVEGTPMDFRKPHRIGERIANVEGGYDHNYVLNRNQEELSFAAKIVEEKSGRTIEVWTTEPGIQFYTGNFLDGSIKGKGGTKYEKNFGFCLETQHFPDSPNRSEFPSVVLRPGQTYSHRTVFKFPVAN